MYLLSATITASTPLGRMHNDVYLVELYAPQLALSVQPGQYCLIRCCHPQAFDPFLRRPFFIHSIQRERGLCTLLVHVQGRGTTWLTSQSVGTELDILGPQGHGWSIGPNIRNLLLVCDMQLVASLPLLIQVALEKELAVTLLCQSQSIEDAYPPALLAPEVEYHIISLDDQPDQPERLIAVLGDYLSWADAACCCVARATSTALYNRFERLRGKHFAQGVVVQPLVCGSGACSTCSIETYSGIKLICRDGPVFELREIVR